MEELLKLIQERQSLRVPFDPDRKVAKQVLRQILEAGRWAPTAHNMQNFEIVVVDDKNILDQISKIENPASPAFIIESYQQLSFSKEELQNKKVGMLANAFPPSWSTPEVKKGIVPEEKTVTTLGKPVKAGPVMLIVLYDPGRRAPASEGDFFGVISLGCVMENMWLMAHALGVGFHVMSVLGTGRIPDKVKSILKIPDYFKVAFSCRLGYPVTVPEKYMSDRDSLGYALAEPDNYISVRRDIEDFAHHNEFGMKGID